MSYKIIGKSFLIWLGIIPLAFLNGGLRIYVLIPLLGTFASPLSGILLCIMIFLLAYFFIPRLAKGKQDVYIKMGMLWMLATIVFEFILGFATGESLSNMLSAYNVFTGNLWLIVVLFTGIVPWLVAKLKNII